MGIERLDEADAPEVAREQVGDQGSADGDRAVPPERRDQRTYPAEFRATVEAEYRAAARDSSWDTAVLELRKAWAAHEAKWPPPRDPGSSHAPAAPGAWRGDSDRHLDPEANAEVERGCGLIHEVGEHIITPAMRAIEAEAPDRHLIGLEYRLKGAERLKEKVAATLEEQPGLTPRQALSAVPDAIRFTFCYSHEHYVSGVTADLERLTARGFELAKPIKNSWESDQYKGINTQWREAATGQLFEVQFHTRASFEAKQLSHAAYERIRNPQTPDAELPELEDFQREVCAKVPIPPGATEIAYLPRKERDG
jgi:hypothetical protein